MTKLQDYTRAEVVAAAQLLAGWLASRCYDTPPAVATLASSLADSSLECGRMTRKEAADMLKVSPATIDRMRKAKQLRFEGHGRLIRLFREDVERYRPK